MGCAGAVQPAGAATEAQYIQAVQDAAKCVEDAGWDVGDPGPDQGGLIWNFGINLPEGVTEAPPELDAIVTDCRERYLDEIERAYLASLVPSGAELEAMKEGFLTCMREAGYPELPTSFTRGDVMQLLAEDESPTAGFACMNEYPRLFLPS